MSYSEVQQQQLRQQQQQMLEQMQQQYAAMHGQPPPPPPQAVAQPPPPPAAHQPHHSHQQQYHQHQQAGGAAPPPPPTERYTTISKIGEGTYGVVFKCFDNETRQYVAQKRIRIDADDEGVPSTAVREISLLREVQHRNCVRLLDVTSHDRKLVLVFEFLDQDLKHLMDRRITALGSSSSSSHTASSSALRHLGPEQLAAIGGAPLSAGCGIHGVNLKRFMYQLIDGIHACHSRRIVHRDLKPQNILVSRDGQTVKIADFGLARTFRVPTATYTHEVVTLWYRAPEILLGARHYLPAVDMWSLGCIMAELAAIRPLFPGDSEIDQLFRIFRVLGTPAEDVWAGVTDLPDYGPSFPCWPRRDLGEVLPMLDRDGIDLLNAMLQYHPHDRVHAFAALQHPWFDEVREEMVGAAAAAAAALVQQPMMASAGGYGYEEQQQHHQRLGVAAY